MKKCFITLLITTFISISTFAQIQVDSLGNVGIGTATPLFKFSLLKNAIGFSHEPTDTAIRIGTYVDGTYGAFLQTHTNHPLNFSANNGLSRLVIMPNGNIGVGTTSPTQKMDVDGKVRIRDVVLDNSKDSVLVVSGDGTVYYRDALSIGSGTGSSDDTFTLQFSSFSNSSCCNNRAIEDGDGVSVTAAIFENSTQPKHAYGKPLSFDVEVVAVRFLHHYFTYTFNNNAPITVIPSIARLTDGLLDRDLTAPIDIRTSVTPVDTWINVPLSSSNPTDNLVDASALQYVVWQLNSTVNNGNIDGYGILEVVVKKL